MAVPSGRDYDRGQRIAGVVFVAILGVALIGAALAYGASGRWELAVLVGGALALLAFFGGGIVAASLARQR